MSDVYVLDASALLAALYDEPGTDRVRALLASARIDSVNLAEVIASLHARGVPEAMIDEILYDLDLSVVPFTTATARRAGLLRGAVGTARLLPGDAACLALAAELGGVAVTANDGWGDLDLGISVELLRP